ncbi:MAG: PHP domain-containing protein [Propionibacteriaceae bacterium]|nr:PHP domain-containing protein [Propionibacteriaceae bacterium]
MRIDLHTHSRVSDGTDSPTELVAAAARARLDVVALTDHDTMAGVAEAHSAGENFGVRVVGGLELTCQYEDVTVHLLGYGCRSDDSALSGALQELRDGRDDRVPKVVAALNAAGVEISADDIKASARPGATLGRPHVADALVALGVVSDRQQAFDRWLDIGRPGYIGHYKVPLAEGVAMITGAGGVAVLAHPWGRESRSVLTADVIGGLAAEGLDGLEVDHQLHDADTRATLRALAGECGLIPTGSSDYHGTGKVDHDLGCNITPDSSFEAIQGMVSQRVTLLGTPPGT